VKLANNYKLTIWVVLLLTIILTSCVGLKQTQLKSQLEKSSCNQQRASSYANLAVPEPIHKVDIDTALMEIFSFQSLNIAHAVGVLDILHDYAKSLKLSKQYPTIENRLMTIEISQNINRKINISSLEISSVASELDCEEERAEQIGSYLQAKEDGLSTKLTVAAIVAGAAGAISTGLILSQGNKGNSAEYTGIATGVTEVILGMLILMNKKEIEFYHPRNALREFWEGGMSSTIFPPSVWYYLNYQNPSEPETPSLRQKILKQWINFGQIADADIMEKEKLKKLYFGNGGKYTAEQLINRANMHDQIEAHINLMKQDLKQLAIELEKIKEH